MMKYATAIRVGAASTEAILRRFTRSATHPTYRAMLEVGRGEDDLPRELAPRQRPPARHRKRALNVV